MRTYGLAILKTTAVAVFLTASVSAQQPGTPLLVGGQSQICADTNLDGCPDQGDACCSASVLPGTPNVLRVLCSQPEDDLAMIKGLPAEFDFNIVSFDPKALMGELQQTFGTNVSPANFITSGKAFPMSSSGGSVQEVMITQPRHSSSGLLCSQNGPAVVVQTGPNTPRMLFGLQDVNCSSCPCVPNARNPTDLKVTVPLRMSDGSLMTRDVFIPLQDNSLTLAADSTSLGSISLGSLGSCILGAAAPTASELGLVLLTLALLAAGAWALGRRRTFAESVPLP